MRAATAVALTLALSSCVTAAGVWKHEQTPLPMLSEQAGPGSSVSVAVNVFMGWGVPAVSAIAPPHWSLGRNGWTSTAMLSEPKEPPNPPTRM